MAKNIFSVESILRTVFIVIFFGLILWYALFQARHLLDGPRISLVNEPGQLQNTQTIQIEGQTENITQISMNGREIYTDQDGEFQESLVLENGYTIMTLTAKDRYGRTTSLSKSFVYRADTIN